MSFFYRFFIKFDFLLVILFLFSNKNEKKIYNYSKQSPFLTLYYPLISSIFSVIIRFMGALLLFFFIFFCNIILLNFIEIIDFDNNFIWINFFNVIIISLLYYHIIYSLKHNLK